MINAKKELLDALESGMKIKCATIAINLHYEKNTIANLKIGYSDKDFLNFLSKLDFEYDNDFGTQELLGTIWLSDKSWLSRGEYDGSEWWEHNKLPEIPDYLM